ncbi:FAD-binding oxidoreductase [Rhizobiaceae bacterium BDR2-2]|uniref:FAD-binding oxidoreductase n=1 Tax=Ectorhizobium quercum TaxID=2965071 RepID=A0AAE3N116_9HYPH|nr:FAD-binding oxidoreductase [Ectorhizobium quercum]MCX8996173.1 FAD-binding oxidoreductase [Ectorhizobium quercum]MCX8998788.1 FAD-binding oxidoreductase [Ectorhizobium quercum]
MTADAIVLGAGIIGVSTALQLALRGKSVVLVDRREPGLETSYGNAGLIQREGIYPYAFPQGLDVLFRYAFNDQIDARYHLSAVPAVAPFLARYWWNSQPERHKGIAYAYAPLIEHSVSEHDRLIAITGAEHLIRREGWKEIYRTAGRRDDDFRAAEKLKGEFGLNYETLTPEELAREEPHLATVFTGALKWTDPTTVRDPRALTLAYVEHFKSLGGRFVTGDAASLGTGPTGRGWQVVTQDGIVEAEQAVLATGPWSDDLTRRLGYSFPLGVKRGYHMHYATKDGATLNGCTMDAERGYFLAPMNQGIRLTTGAEFALRDAPKTPVQLEKAERIARSILPLTERLDPEPWMGARPCTPDMIPVIGKAPRHQGLWFAFGHAHHGLTLGPITGRVLSEAMYGETPVIDITPYRAERFNP